MTGERRWDADDIGIVAAGAAYAVLGLLPWYESHAGSATLTLRGWNLGLLGVLSLLLALVAAGMVAIRKYRPQGPEVPLAPTAEPWALACGALLLGLVQVLSVPTIGSVKGERTNVLALAAFVVLLQAIFATRALARTGFRAPPP